MRNNEWKRIATVLTGMRAAIELICKDLDPASEEERWLMSELGEIHDRLTLCIGHCEYNAGTAEE